MHAPKEKAPPHWVSQYLGKPWVAGARGPDAFDCYGLLWHVYENQFGISMPVYAEACDRDLKKVMVWLSKSPELANWQRVEKPFHGAAVGMSQHELFHHVGVFVVIPEGEFVLHSMDKRRAVLTPLSRLRSMEYSFKRIEFFKNNQWPA